MIKLNSLSPLLAQQIEAALRADGHDVYADAVAELDVLGRCCTNSFCAGFRTADIPLQVLAEFGIRLIPGVPGLVCILVVDGGIAMVELYNRQDVRAVLTTAFP